LLCARQASVSLVVAQHGVEDSIGGPPALVLTVPVNAVESLLFCDPPEYTAVELLAEQLAGDRRWWKRHALHGLADHRQLAGSREVIQDGLSGRLLRPILWDNHLHRCSPVSRLAPPAGAAVSSIGAP